MWNILVLALCAPSLVFGVAIPSDDADSVKEGWSTVSVQKQNAPPREAILWQPLHAVNSPPRTVSVEEDIAELEYLQAQLKELKYLICMKKRAINQLLGQDRPSFAQCNSLKCFAQAIKDKARVAAHTVFAKVMGDSDEEEALRFPKIHWPKPPFHHGKPGNHTCGPPGHGKSNHTRPHPPLGHGRGNRTHPHPPPHFKKPHLPFCHYPPPPLRHRKPPHGKPPPHRESPEDEPDAKLSLPPLDRRPSQGLLQTLDAMDQETLHTDASYGSLESHKVSTESINSAYYVLGLGLIVFIFTFIVKSIHRRFSDPTQKAARQARRAERQHRRSLRRAAHRVSIMNVLTRLGLQDEEKLAAQQDDDAQFTTMTEDIAGLMNAADMVSEMVAAEEGRARRSVYFGGEGEVLPVYDGHDNAEHVADGNMGNSGYIPSLAGSASDILGADTKQ